MMGNKFGRKKTRKFKTQQAQANSVVCKRGNEAIDKSVCEVYQVRNPEQCFGCQYFRG